jgi:hypothetical protein
MRKIGNRVQCSGGLTIGAAANGSQCLTLAAGWGIARTAWLGAQTINGNAAPGGEVEVQPGLAVLGFYVASGAQLMLDQTTWLVD